MLCHTKIFEFSTFLLHFGNKWVQNLLCLSIILASGERKFHKHKVETLRYLEDLWIVKQQLKHAELADPICEPAREVHTT
jgi:hypothetical protein